MTAVWRATTGGFFALAGLVLWRMAHMIPGPDQISTGLAGRWAAIALAVGGLLLAFRRRLTLVWLLLGVVWLVADAFLDPRTVVAIVTGVALVVGGLLLVVPASTRDSRAGAPAWPRLVYAGTLVGIRPDVIVSASQDVFDQVWLALALATAMLVLATLLAAEAGPRPSPVARSTRANVVFAVLALHTGAVVLRFAAADDFVPDFAVDALHSLLVTPLILGTLVALTGVLAPDGRGARTFAGLLAVGPLVVAPFAGNAASAALRRLEASLGDPAPMAWMVVTSTLVTGVLLGLVVLVAARLLWRERLIEPEPARADRSEQQATAAAVDGAGGGSLGAGAGDWRRWAGTLLTGLGILAWLAVVALVQPRLGAGSTAPGGGVPPADADQLAALAVLALDARWAGMVAAVGGLRLLGGRPGFGVVAVVGGWVAADMVLLTTGMAPWVAVAVAAAVLAGAVAVAVRRRDPGSATPAWGYVYSGAAAGVAVALLAGVEPWMGRYLAAWTLPAVAGLAVLLVAACVANALALASAQFQRRRRSGVSRQFGTGGWVGEEGR